MPPKSKSESAWEEIAAVYRADMRELYSQALTLRHLGESIAGEVEQAAHGGRAVAVAPLLTTLMVTPRQIVHLTSRLDIAAKTMWTLRTRLPLITVEKVRL